MIHGLQRVPSCPRYAKGNLVVQDMQRVPIVQDLQRVPSGPRHAPVPSGFGVRANMTKKWKHEDKLGF